MCLKFENLRNIDWKSNFLEIWVQYKCFWKAFHLILMHSIHKIPCFEEFLHKMLCFSKIWFFQIFDRSILFLNWSKLRLKFWFEFTWFYRFSIVAGSIECKFWSIKSNFWSIENRSKSFLKNISFSRVCHYSSFFKKFFLSLFNWSRFKANFFVIFPQISSRVFDF